VPQSEPVAPKTAQKKPARTLLAAKATPTAIPDQRPTVPPPEPKPEQQIAQFRPPEPLNIAPDPPPVRKLERRDENVFRPEPAAPAPPPIVPPAAAPPRPAKASGVLVWSGQLEKGRPVLLEALQASAGTLHGDPLPGMPVIIELEPRDLAVAEAPSPSNGWRRLVFRSLNKRNIVVTMRWRLAQEAQSE
jgi:hypothetical protein